MNLLNQRARGMVILVTYNIAFSFFLSYYVSSKVNHSHKEGKQQLTIIIAPPL